MELKSFKIRVGGKILDYHLGKELDLKKVKYFFRKKYKVVQLWSGGRHILGILEKGGEIFFLKMATTEGISEVTKNEYNWNEQFNKLVPRKASNFWVPQNKDCGEYNKLFYLVTDRFEGELLAKRPERMQTSIIFQNLLPSVIEFSELIQELTLDQLSDQENSDHKMWFLKKTKSWYEDIPEDIRKRYKVMDLLKIVENGIARVQKRPRHGDFTPWHLINLGGGKIGLIDGEHTRSNGVEYYDIGYFIQRVFSVLKNPSLAQTILTALIKKNYDLEKLRVILAARAIGGFLDESLTIKPNYEFSNMFKKWVSKS